MIIFCLCLRKVETGRGESGSQLDQWRRGKGGAKVALKPWEEQHFPLSLPVCSLPKLNLPLWSTLRDTAEEELRKEGPELHVVFFKTIILHKSFWTLQDLYWIIFARYQWKPRMWL